MPVLRHVVPMRQQLGFVGLGPQVRGRPGGIGSLGQLRQR